MAADEAVSNEVRSALLGGCTASQGTASLSSGSLPSAEIMRCIARRVATVARLHNALARRFQSRTDDAGLFSAAWRSYASGQAVETPRDWLGGNMAAVLSGAGKLDFMPWALPASPPRGHVRIAMQRVGICGSDVHYWKRGHIGSFVVSSPLVLGHEASGEVVQLGGGVLSPRVGARVALEPGVPCWQSQLAREGRYNLDPDIVFAATPPHHGSLCSFVDHPADWCYELPPSMSYEEGAFCEPLSVGIHAVRRGGVAPGKRVAVLGAGPIGLMVLMAARVFGADRVVISDLENEKLAIARDQGVRISSVSASFRCRSRFRSVWFLRVASSRHTMRYSFRRATRQKTRPNA